MGLLRRLPIQWTTEKRWLTLEEDPPTWGAFVRLVVGITADLSVIGWAMAYVGRSPNTPLWVGKCMAFGMFGFASLVYALSAKEFLQLVHRDKSKFGKLWRLTLGMIFVQLVSVVPAIYGLATGRPG